MAAFKVTITHPATRDLRRLDPQIRLRLLAALKTLEQAPLPRGEAIKRIAGVRPPLYRLRTGDFRTLYRIEDGQILVLAVVHRSELERWLRELN